MASYFEIDGGTPLQGTVEVAGSKNATLPMMAAAILTDRPVRLEGVPRVSDVSTLAAILGRLGVEVTWTGANGLILQADSNGSCRADYDLVGRMRAGFCVLGPLLARRGKATVALPGGCSIGPRPVDLHLAGLTALGATFQLKHGYVIGQVDRLRGATVSLQGQFGPTVTGTTNLLSAAVLAEGETTIHSAATEPEVVDFGRMLLGLGAKIDGLGSSTIRVEGVDRLERNVVHRVIPDRIEAATLLMATAATGGSIELTGADPSAMCAPLEKFFQLGDSISTKDDRIVLRSTGVLRKPLSIQAAPYPGMPTDLQPIWTALATQVEGKSRISDRVFPERFGHLDELARLGAKAQWSEAGAVVHGRTRLTGADVTGGDLRATAALVVAALAAEGTSRVFGLEHLDRGYDRLNEKLRRLGAKIRRIEAN